MTRRYPVVVTCPNCDELGVTMNIARDSGGRWSPPDVSVEQDGPCVECGHKNFTMAQELAMEEEALHADGPARDDYFPEDDDQ